MGADDTRAACRGDRLAAPAVVRGRGAQGRPPERALHGPGQPVPGHRARVGGSRGRADRRDPVRRPAVQDRAAGLRGVRLGARHLHRGHDRQRDDRGGRRRRRPAAPRPDGDAAVLRLQHGRLLEPLAVVHRSAWIPRSCRTCSSSTGSARAPTARSCGRASARTAGCSSGSSSASRARPRPWTPRSGRLPAPGALDVDGLAIADGALEQLLALDVPGWLEEMGLIREHFARFGDKLPAQLAAYAD